MKTRLLTAMLVTLGAATFTTVLAHAQTTSNGPYYATPSWDQKLQCDTSSTCPRFIVLSNWNNEAVLDRETGLVWEQSPAANPLNVSQCSAAADRCHNLATGNRIGWRLPTLQELSSLPQATTIVQPVGPPSLLVSLPSGHPFTVQANVLFWSATTVFDNPADAWTLSLPVGLGPLPFPKTTGSQGIWCVRSGAPGSDPQ